MRRARTLRSMQSHLTLERRKAGRGLCYALLLAWVGSGAVGCGDEDNPPGRNGSVTEAAFCDAWVAFVERCGEVDGGVLSEDQAADERSECTQEHLNPNYSDDYYAAYLACLNHDPCVDDNPNLCAVPAAAAVVTGTEGEALLDLLDEGKPVPAPVDDKLAEACVVTVQTCGDHSNQCALLAILNEGARETATACLEGGCGSYIVCIQNAVGLSVAAMSTGEAD